MEHRYGVYGITLRSDVPLALPLHRGADLAEVSVRTASTAWFRDALGGSQATAGWIRHAELRDGGNYLGSDGVGEFHVSVDGRVLHCRQADATESESFQVYLLGQALSFALVQQGLEPLHATTVLVGGEAVGFLGDCGSGKSTLAAEFVAAGHAVLGDDLLIAQDGLAQPGPPRLKLFPEIAARCFADVAALVAMNRETRKLIVPLAPEQQATEPARLRALYVLAPPDPARPVARIESVELSRREAFFALIEHTFNYRVASPERLQRLFRAAEQLAATIPVRRLSYPRDLEQLAAVRERIEKEQSTPCLA